MKNYSNKNTETHFINMRGYLATLFIIGLGIVPLKFAFGQAGIVEYTDQDSANTFFHSGICTSTGTVWDTKFAAMVQNATTNGGYNEIAFAFMECYGGGMIDELSFLSPSAFTSAARCNEPSLAWDSVGRPANPANYESTYNLAFAPVAGGAAVNAIKQAAITGRNNDALGPVRNLFPPFTEHPQYFTASGNIGDSITLHRNNPVFGQNPNTKYIAILFGGSTNEAGNNNSLTTIKNALTARGYAAAEMTVINPPGRAIDLQNAWGALALPKQGNAGAQIFFWSSWGHGDWTFDIFGFIKKQLATLGLGSFTLRTSYTFNLDPTFLSEINRIAGQYPTSPASLDGPFFEIDSSEQLINPSVTLATPTHPASVMLIPFDQVDVFGDGLLWQTRFALNTTGLAFSTSGNSFSISFSNTTSPLPITLAGIVTGLRSNTPVPTQVPSLSILSSSGGYRQAK